MSVPFYRQDYARNPLHYASDLADGKWSIRQEALPNRLDLP